ncbi:MAG: hypothetical protein M9886_02855 [Candidatus Nanopelagicales bacterium]|nr:hypothetical protein [Candidatus Nanopelagicales bacterium]
MSARNPGIERDELPLTVLVADPTAGGADVYDKTSALHIAIVDRVQHPTLDDTIWSLPGVYLLLDRPDPATGHWGVYVGKAPAGVKNRLREHLRKKDHWYRAVCIKSDTSHGWNSAEVGWLEGRLYDLMRAAEHADLHNGNQPIDETLPVFTRNTLERAILPISRVLTLIGHNPAPENTDDRPLLPGPAPRRYDVTLVEVLDRSGLEPGSLVSTNGAWPAQAVLNADGTITFDGQTYHTPSAAAAAAKHGPANGWEFWAVPGPNRDIPLATYRKEMLDGRPVPERTPLGEQNELGRAGGTPVGPAFGEVHRFDH